MFLRWKDKLTVGLENTTNVVHYQKGTGSRYKEKLEGGSILEAAIPTFINIGRVNIFSYII